MSGYGQRGEKPVYYFDECLDLVHRVAVGRPCPDRDHCRRRLLNILEAILMSRRSYFEEPDAD